MKSVKLIGLAFGASLALSTAALAQDITVAVAGPMTGGESAFGRQMKNGAEMAVADLNAAGGVLGKKLALDVEDDACDPKQARSVAEKIGSAEDPVRRRPLLLVVVDPRLRGLCRRQRAADHAGLDQPALHRAQALERGARLRPRRPAGPGRRPVHRQELQGQEHRDPQRQDHLRQRPCRRDQEGAQQGRRHRKAVRILQQGRQGLQRHRLAPEAREHRSRLCRRLSSGIRPDHASDARPGPEDRADGGRRAGRQGVRLDHRPGRRRHAVHLRPRSAQEADREGDRRQVQGQEHRPRRLHALHLRRVPGVVEGRREGRHHRPEEGDGHDQGRHPGTP